jgi:hypothetical protein
MPSSADTLNVVTEKLRNTINEIQDRYESFIDSNQLYKQGKINEREFFASIGDYLIASSAMNFIAVQAIFEMRSVLQQKSSSTKQAGNVGPSSSSTSLHGTTGNSKFTEESQMPRTDQFTMPKPQQQVLSTMETPARRKSTDSGQSARTMKDCLVCGKTIPEQAKFCTRCGNSQ